MQHQTEVQATVNAKGYRRDWWTMSGMEINCLPRAMAVSSSALLRPLMVMGPSAWVEFRVHQGGVPGTPYLPAWANSGKSGRASERTGIAPMAIRQVCLERLALSASGYERVFNGWSAASREETD